MLALKAGREARAGWLVALALMVKPFGVILVPWLIARGKTGSIVDRGRGHGRGVLVACDVLRARGKRSAPSGLVDERKHDHCGGSDAPRQRVRWLPCTSKWFGATETASHLHCRHGRGACSASLEAVFLGRKRVPQPDGLEAGLLMALIPLLSPQAWDFVLVVCTPAMVCLCNSVDRLPRALQLLSVVALAAIGLHPLRSRRAHWPTTR